MPTSQHIFATAVQAYRSMLNEGSSQCVLVSGESGAGKTESAKYVLQVLTVAGQQEEMEKTQPLKRRSVAEQIMLGNPVLEAFGSRESLLRLQVKEIFTSSTTSTLLQLQAKNLVRGWG